MKYLSKISKKFRLKKNAGFTLVEALIYMALLAVMLGGIISSMATLSSSYRSVKTERDIELSAITAMDRIVRETRNATSINTAQSSFNVSNGSLGLNSINASGTLTTLLFSVATTSNRLMLTENGESLGPLTTGDVSVTSLVFRSYSTTTSSAVKIEMILSATSTSNISVSKNFYGTAVLRGSY